MPKILMTLVDESVRELGKLIASELGPEGFERIESIRRRVKSAEGQQLPALLHLKQDLARLPPQTQYSIAHSFSLMLELINACEAAYRTWRLKQETQTSPVKVPSRDECIIHVLTAHPTESRNPDILYYFKKIQRVLETQLENPQEENLRQLQVLLRWVWRIPMSKQRKPSVMDEAEYVYSLALQDDILQIFLGQSRQQQPFYLRTWVGGDKDGHPGVDERTMLGSLQMSRRFLLSWTEKKITEHVRDLAPLVHSLHPRDQIRSLWAQSQELKREAKKLKKIQAGDARRIHRFRNSLRELSTAYKSALHVESPSLSEILLLLRIFPGLVVPLELREASQLVHNALNKPTATTAISRMLKTLARISPSHDPRYYVRGFVLSQTESVQDILAGMSLAEKYLGHSPLPVVPLFESAQALKSSPIIVEELLKSPSRRRLIQKYWSAKLEVMVGYSDSAKENGSFPSRFLIHAAIDSLEKIIKKHALTPIFFHGSGGSVERGGGSVQEQTAWWPRSALANVKVTVQGEMIYRNYTAPEILARELAKFHEACERVRQKKASSNSPATEKKLRRLSDFVQNAYREILNDPHFVELIEDATPYAFLKDLRFGSRPAKRQGKLDLQNLRAIPWILCWTQTRILFPTWWGVGSFWQRLSPNEKIEYKKIFDESPLFGSYIKLLGFTLQKIELEIFALYLESSKLPKEATTNFIERFKTELAACKRAVRELSGEENLLWYRPWLKTSIHLRSPLIHPLNVLQLIALEEKDTRLLRETVTGIASGMLTTG